MRKLILFIAIIMVYSVTSFAGEIKTVKDLFPKSSEMKGGSSSWILSGISEEKRDRCKVYENTYAYYSTKKEKILDIERSNTYVVSARIFDCDNFGVALDTYKNLADISKKHAKRKQVAPVPFGEQGIMVALPLSAKQGKSQQANFYLTYIFRNFVVQVYSDDGFAQMDMSGEIEKRIYELLEGKGINYAVNKINLSVSVDGSEYIDTLSFTGDKIASVLVSGLVIDANNKPVSNATIKALETNQTTKTDKNGRFKFNVSSGKGKSISMTKTIFLPFALQGQRLALSSGFYPLEVTNKDKIIYSGLLNVLVDDNNKVSGYLIDRNLNKIFPVSGYVRGDNLTLDANCTEAGSSFNCRKIFKGVLKSDYLIQGKAIGVGSGDFTIDKKKFTIFTESPYLSDTGASLKLSVLENGKQKYSSQNNLALNAGKNNKSYIELNTLLFQGRDMLYFKEAYIRFNVLGLNIDNRAFINLYEKNISSNGFVSIHKIAPLKTITKKDNKEVIIDISSQIRQPAKDGYLLALEGDEKDYIVFDNKNTRLDISYYGKADYYKVKKVVSIALTDMNGEDIVSNKSSVEKDGNEDIIISLNLAANGRTFEDIEVIIDAGSKRMWNTDTNDIYPAVAVLQNGGILNNNNGSISIPLENDEEIYNLHLYKGSLKETDIKSITVKVTLDGKQYENTINLK